MKDGICEKLICIVIVTLLIIGGYKWQEWKLEYVWGIQNPSFFQVLDSMGNRK